MAPRRDLRHRRRLHRARVADRGAAAPAPLPLPAPRRAAAARLARARARLPGREPERQRAAARPRRDRARGDHRGDRDRRARAGRDPGWRDPGGDPGHPRAPGARADHDGASGAAAPPALAALPRPRDPAAGAGRDRRRGAAPRRRRDLRVPGSCSPTTSRPRRRNGRPDRSRVESRSPSSTAPRSTASRARSPPTSRPSGYKVGAITNTAPGFEKTEVIYADGQKPAAQKVAARPRGRGRSSRSTASCASWRPERRRGRDRRRGPALSARRARVSLGAALFFCLLAATLVAAVLVVRARTPDLVLEVTEPAGHRPGDRCDAGGPGPRRGPDHLLRPRVRRRSAGRDRRQPREHRPRRSTPTPR